MQQIILASQSPRRKQLLEMAEIEFVVQIADIDETPPAELNVRHVPEFLAQKKAFEIISEEEFLAMDNYEIIVGAKEILEYFKENKFVLALITMQGRQIAEKILNRVAPSIFEHIITRDESNDRLEQIQKTIKYCRLEPNQTLVIGDRIHDVKCAKLANCVPILFKTKPISYNCKIIASLLELKQLNF